MIVVAFVSFSLFNFVGDPVISLTGEDSSIERQAEVREAIGLNDPVYIQFSRFLGNVIQGDFGISYQLKREVSDLIAERMPATLELVFVSAILAIVVGVILLVASPSALFTLNWKEKTGKEKFLMFLFYSILVYIINIIFWIIK